ncbi:MAG: UDP-2,4-diacetamido-2,4,6-trideoxy-beta-L-altropyranose hydrolase, partial [Kordiimonadaceae bacterium]|nr:UDP-2,4-diacetamido-2,4,6-trideoxy-beta-L-altropyranose hydrolase [Kordiimonadaceae bacterium]
MNVTFRVDASIEMGTGHVMRCLTLANALKEKGANCQFICREHPGNLLQLIRAQRFKAYGLPFDESDQRSVPVKRHKELAHTQWLGTDWETDADEAISCMSDRDTDWLVVDHYALDVRWEEKLKPLYRRLMVIDDLADREHICDLLIDQNLGRSPKDYERLAPSTCKLLVGPNNALLRPEFGQLREASLLRRSVEPRCKELLITLGGVDKDNATVAVMQALQASSIPSDCQITVVMGANAPWLKVVRKLALQMPWQTNVLVSVTNMAELMAASDLAIGAAGSTTWERCC